MNFPLHHLARDRTKNSPATSAWPWRGSNLAELVVLFVALGGIAFDAGVAQACSTPTCTPTSCTPPAPPGGCCTVPTGTYANEAACTFDWTGKNVVISNGARLSSDGYDLTILAHDLTLQGSIDTRSASGGDVTIAATANVVIDGPIATEGNATRDDSGDGGTVTIDAYGALSVLATINTRGDSFEYSDDGDPAISTGAGGGISLAGATVVVSGDLIAISEADDGGAVDITATVAYVTVTGNVTTDATRYFDTDLGGGSIDIEAPGAINVDGRFSSTGAHGPAGAIEITSDEGEVTISNSITANGSGFDSSGGDIGIEADRSIRITGRGRLIANGTVEADAPNDATAPAGNVSLSLTGGGEITIESGARIETRGLGSDGIYSGTILIEDGCTMTLAGEVNSAGQGNGTNLVTYRETLALTGKLIAPNGMGSGNLISCRSNGAGACVTPPTGVTCETGVCTAAGRVMPDAFLVPTSLASCIPGCGNGILEADETCDDGNLTPCDGCSPACQPQTSGATCGATVCMAGGTCTGPGTCTGSSPIICSDGNACTDDSTCSTTTGCTFTPIVCPDDNDPQTIDSCDPMIGCVYTPHPFVEPLEVPELIAILNQLMDPCMGADEMACALGATSCASLRSATSGTVSVTKLLGPAGDQRLSVSGRATLTGVSPALDLVANGVRVLVTDAVSSSTNDAVVDVQLPPGAFSLSGRGWVANSTSSVTKWTYQDRTASPLAGITKASFSYNVSTGLLKFNVKGRGSYSLSESPLPVTAVVVLDAAAATTDQCVQLNFTPSPHLCRLTGSGSGLKCK